MKRTQIFISMLLVLFAGAGCKQSSKVSGEIPPNVVESLRSEASAEPEAVEVAKHIKDIPVVSKLPPPAGLDADQIRPQIKEFLESRTAPSGLLSSFRNTAPYSFSQGTGKFHRRLYGKEGYLDDQAFTYDLALGVIGLLLCEKREQAEKILDALRTEFYLPKNGSKGLFNSYVVTSKIPVEDLELGVDGDRMHAGPTLWVALAALNHMKLVRNTRYLEFTLDIVQWCRKDLTYYRFPDGERGAISMGMGWGPDWSKIFATEHNVDYYAVLRMLRSIYRESSPEVRAIFHEKKIDEAWLDDEMAHVGRWLREVVFLQKMYCFRAGVNMFGVDPTRVIDGTSWGIDGVGAENLEALELDVDKLGDQAEEVFLAHYELPSGRIIYGFDITDGDGYKHSRRPLIWFEATGQQIIAYMELSRHFAKQGDAAKAEKFRVKADKYLRYMREFQVERGMGAALPYMSVNPGQKQIFKTMVDEWEIPRAGRDNKWVGSMSSTMWYLYCLHDYYNPMKWEND